MRPRESRGRDAAGVSIVRVNFHDFHPGADLFIDDGPGAPICRFWLGVSQRQCLVGDGDTKLKGQISLPHKRQEKVERR